MKHYFLKMRGSAKSPTRPAFKQIIWSWFGGLLGIAVIAYLSVLIDKPLVIPSFGASCVLAFGISDSPLAQPRNIIGGHFVSTLVGLTFFMTLGSSWWVMALAVATAIACMQLTGTVHPPAGADPLIVILSEASWLFLATPVLAGSLILVFLAIVFNNLSKDRVYPKYWW
jgi:CBS-domain-containing membrane protein